MPVIATNLTSLFNVTHHLKMAERGLGPHHQHLLVNGVKGQAGQTNYSAAKAGVIGFSKGAGCRAGHQGVTVNAIARATSAPTWSWRSGRNPVRASSTPCRSSVWRPEEIGAAVVLASDLAGYVTGAT